MNLLFRPIGKPPRNAPAAQLIEDYVQRSSHYTPVDLRYIPSEAALLVEIDRNSRRRTPPALVLTDSRGQTLSSEEFAAALGRLRDSGRQQLIVAIGPPDGWSPATLRRADLTFSFGRITLPHELAAVIAAEQVYRALTILAGHPYHSGH